MTAGDASSSTMLQTFGQIYRGEGVSDQSVSDSCSCLDSRLVQRVDVATTYCCALVYSDIYSLFGPQKVAQRDRPRYAR